MSVKFLGASATEVVSEQQWDTVVLRLGGDATYHSLGYHRASAHLEPAGTVPVLLHHRGELGESALPLLLRPLPDADGWDATTAYGYGGPVSTTSGEDPAFGAAIDDWAARNGVVATFIRYHPLLGNHRMGPSPAEVVPRGLTAVWDLAGTTDLLEGMHGHHRRAARKADRAGLGVRITRGPRDLSALSSAVRVDDAAPERLGLLLLPRQVLARAGQWLLPEPPAGGGRAGRRDGRLDPLSPQRPLPALPPRGIHRPRTGASAPRTGCSSPPPSGRGRRGSRSSISGAAWGRAAPPSSPSSAVSTRRPNRSPSTWASGCMTRIATGLSRAGARPSDTSRRGVTRRPHKPAAPPERTS